MNKALALACLLCLSLCLSACQPVQQEMLEIGPAYSEMEATKRWQEFETLSHQLQPYRLNGSLRVGNADDSNRVSFILWANANPVRLDIVSSLGSSVMKMRAYNGFLLTLLPQDEKAYIAMDNADGTKAFLGIALPLGLGRFSALLQGRYIDVFGNVISSHAAATGAGIVYSLDDGTELELSPAALPRRWNHGQNWQLEMDFDEQGMPRKVAGKSPLTGHHMTLTIKERATTPAFSAEQMDLLIPPSVEIFSVQSQNAHQEKQ